MTGPLTIGVFGIDGSGKTTQTGLLASRLPLSTERVTIESRIRREAHRVGWELGHPNGNALFGRATLAVCGALEASLELAVLRNSPNPHRILLFDRYAPTWEAIAGLDGEPLSPGLVATLGRLPPLDLEIFLEVDVDVAASRILSRNGALRGREDRSYLARYREAYRTVLAARPGVVSIDGDRPVAEVHRTIVDCVAPLVRARGMALE